MCTEKLDYLRKALNRRSFHGLMDLYEQNYSLLDTLISDMGAMPVQTESRVAGSPTLFLTIEERCKYTTMVSITYYFETSDGERIADPDLRIRIYHDAMQAEATSCRNTGSMALPASRVQKSPTVDCIWDSNLFLEKWLKYSLEQGHLFTPVNAVKSSPGELEKELEPL